MKNWLMSLAATAARWLPISVKRRLYNIPGLAAYIRQSLNRAVPKGITEVKIAGGGNANLWMALDLQQEKDYWLGTYEPELQAAVADFVIPGMVAYDIGANIGYVSLLLGRAVGHTGRVIAFEALPENLERLRQNIALNHLERVIKVVSAAVTEHTGRVTFQVGPSGGTGKAAGSAGRHDLRYAKELVVPGVGIDELVYWEHYPPPQIIKLDIEGGEVLALPGMQRVLAQEQPILLIELHGPEAARVTWEICWRNHYRICWMQPGYPPVGSLEKLEWKAYIVALPEKLPTGK